MSIEPASATRLLTPEEVAECLRVSVNYVVENGTGWPHVRLGRARLYTEAHVAQIIALHEQRPETPVASRNTYGRRTRSRSGTP